MYEKTKKCHDSKMSKSFDGFVLERIKHPAASDCGYGVPEKLFGRSSLYLHRRLERYITSPRTGVSSETERLKKDRIGTKQSFSKRRKVTVRGETKTHTSDTQ